MDSQEKYIKNDEKMNPKKSLLIIDDDDDTRKETSYGLKLFISGRSVHNGKTIADIKSALKASLPGRYTDIIDVIEKPDVAYEAKAMMTPTLVKTSPPR